MEMENVESMMSMIRVGGLFTGGFILLVSYGLAHLVTATMSGLGERFTEKRLLLQQVSAFARFGIYFIGILLAVVSSVELSREAVLAISGSLGLAMGFALKDQAASVIAGITILIDKPFQVGDRIRLGETYGDVIAIGLRSVRVVTLDDNLVTIPNNKLMTDVVSSGNAGELTMLVQMDFFIGADQDVNLAKTLVGDAYTSSRFCTLEKPWTVLVNSVVHEGYFAFRIRAKGYVVDVKFEKALETDVTLRVAETFRANGIQPPARLNRVAGEGWQTLPPSAPSLGALGSPPSGDA
jgi:small-conductance mechanosensitive channel